MLQLQYDSEERAARAENINLGGLFWSSDGVVQSEVNNSRGV
jgi:hypothetical protein